MVWDLVRQILDDVRILWSEFREDYHRRNREPPTTLGPVSVEHWEPIQTASGYHCELYLYGTAWVDNRKRIGSIHEITDELRKRWAWHAWLESINAIPGRYAVIWRLMDAADDGTLGGIRPTPAPYITYLERDRDPPIFREISETDFLEALRAWDGHGGYESDGITISFHNIKLGLWDERFIARNEQMLTPNKLRPLGFDMSYIEAMENAAIAAMKRLRDIQEELSRVDQTHMLDGIQLSVRRTGDRLRISWRWKQTVVNGPRHQLRCRRGEEGFPGIDSSSPLIIDHGHEGFVDEKLQRGRVYRYTAWTVRDEVPSEPLRFTCYIPEQKEELHNQKEWMDPRSDIKRMEADFKRQCQEMNLKLDWADRLTKMEQEAKERVRSKDSLSEEEKENQVQVIEDQFEQMRMTFL